MKNVWKNITLLICLFSFANVNAASFMVTVTMKNDDVISGKTPLAKILVKTPYGDLNIPAERIMSLSLGLAADHSKDAEVLTNLKKLQSAATDDATTFNTLLGMGPAILSAVKQYAESPDYKVSEKESYTVEDLLDELYKKAGLNYGEPVNDIVTYDGANTVEGSVVFPDMVLQSNYGTLNIKRDMIKSIEIAVLDDGSLGDNTFKVKANTHITGNEYGKGWLNTGVKVKSGDPFTITASGKIVLQSLSGGVYGPDGYLSGTKDAAYTDDMETKYGSLVYKIGENGEQQNAGSKWTGMANDEGTIYLSVYETVYDKNNTGFYIVKVAKK
jgi:hypothetical protein